jgi:hypothetical protein
MGYNSATIHLLFNLWYRDFNYIPAYENNLPQVDHIFPQSKLREMRVPDSNTGRMAVKYRNAEINQLANCMLLSQEENGAGGKSDTPPEIWFAGKDRDYLDKHLVPANPSLWKLDRFDNFIEERKKLIYERFKSLIAPATVSKTP